MSTSAILEMIREDGIKYDPWGTCMSWHFAICDVMTEWAPPYPPSEWGYHQALGGVETDSFQYQELTAMMESKEITEHDLLAVGKILHRYEQILEKKGRSY